MVSYFNPRSLTGATGDASLLYLPSLISIHAPSRERLSTYCLQADGLYFNPRSLAGATLVSCRLIIRIAISIHAPSRERLEQQHDERRDCQQFQSTLPRGSDSNVVVKHANYHQFQSTLPRGSDSSLYVKVIKQLYFNPRSLAGAT